MAKWSGIGQPNTRRKLHRWRLQQRLERDALAKRQRAFDAMLERQWRKQKGDEMLVERGTASAATTPGTSGERTGPGADGATGSA